MEKLLKLIEFIKLKIYLKMFKLIYIKKTKNKHLN